MSFISDKTQQRKCGKPAVWGSVILIILLFLAFITVPALMKWWEMRTDLANAKNIAQEYEMQIKEKQTKLASIKKEFNKIAKDFLKEEKLLFPEKIDTNKIAKIFELYSLQYSLIDSRSNFEVSSISFSKQTSEHFTKTTANLSIKSNKDSLIDFIYFIQNNKLPEKLRKAQDSSSSLLKNDIPTTKFLRENVLPIANINSINSSRDEDENAPTGQLNTEIQIDFFSQKTNDE